MRSTKYRSKLFDILDAAGWRLYYSIVKET